MGSRVRLVLPVVVAAVVTLSACGAARAPLPSPAQPVSPSAVTTAEADPLSALKPDPAYKEARPAPYAWTRYGSIAHGMGGIDADKRVTNSLEAFLENYRRGFRVFEVDLVQTSDGELVARHDWEPYMYGFLGQTVDDPERVMTRSEFEEMPIHGRYTPLTAEDLVTIMRAYPDVYIMTDTKSRDPGDTAKAMGQLVAAMGADTVLADRVIIQIYDSGGLQAVRGAHDFKNIVFTFYMLESDEIGPAIEFAAAKGIKVVTYPEAMATPEFNRNVAERGLMGAVHTINDAAVASKLRDSGVGLIYTDFLAP